MWSKCGEAWWYSIWGRQDFLGYLDRHEVTYPVKGYHADQTKRTMRVLIVQLAKGRCYPTLTRGMHACQGHVRLFVILWTVACQAPLSMGFSRQEYWSGVLFLLQVIFQPRDWTHISCISFTTSTTWEVLFRLNCNKSTFIK